MTIKQLLRLAVIAGAVLILPFGSLLAQTVNGSLNGTVTDTTKAPVVGAAVTVTNEVTQDERTATTQNDGSYAVPQLAPGTYTVSVSKATFAEQKRTGLELLVNQAATLDFTLNIGNVTETVKVEAGAALLDTSTATLGTVIESKDIVDLPLNGRNFTQLILLSPGAAAAASSQQGLYEVNPGGTTTAVSGQRPQQNNYTLDGVLNNNIFANVWAIAPPPDALQEFNVESHITDAAFTIASGANVNITTKAGTNQFHGAVWEFLRNDVLDAKNAFAAPGTASTPYRQNQYGVLFSGPVLRKNTWFSGYWWNARCLLYQSQCDKLV